MCKSQHLSENTKVIVDNLLSEFGGSPFINEYDELLKAIYASLPEADSQILALVGECHDLTEYVSAEELKSLHCERSAIVHFCLDKIKSMRDRAFEEYLIPSQIFDLCKGITDIAPGSDVYLPFAGMAEFAYDLHNCNVSGYEINNRVWAMSQIALSLQGVKAQIAHKANVPALELKSKQYDVIFSFPPVLMGSEAYNIVYEIYELATKSLKDDGLMFCVLPMSFCHDTNSKGWFKLRKILFDYDGLYTTAVISLPRIFSWTSGEFCLLCWAKDRGDKVVLVDATDLSTTHQNAKRKFDVLNFEAVLDVIKAQDELHVWVGHASDLGKGLNLTPQRYLFERHQPIPKNGEQLLPLSDLIELIPLERTTMVGAWPTIRFSSLSTSNLNCEVRDDDPDLQTDPFNTVLNKDSLLIAFVGDKMKVGKISGLSRLKCVSLRHGILPFKVKSPLVTEDYILHCLVSDSTREQARCLSVGKVVTTVANVDDFLKIKVIVPSVTDQERICRNDAMAGLSDAMRQKVEANELFRQNMHLVKHSIGQSIANLNNWWKVLQRARKENGGIVDDNAEVGNFTKTRVADIYTNLQLAIEQLQDKVSKFDRSYGLKSDNLAVTEFIETYITEHQSPIFRFIYEAGIHHAAQTIPEVDFNEVTGEARETGKIILNEGDPIEYAQFAAEALTIVFDNIISNAIAHGFKGREHEDNIVRIELKSEGDSYVIAISNNGNAVPEGFSQKEVFSYGMSSSFGKADEGKNLHFGIGGFEVQNIMREFGDDAEFVSTPDEEFTVTYRLILNNTNFVSIEL